MNKIKVGWERATNNLFVVLFGESLLESCRVGLDPPIRVAIVVSRDSRLRGNDIARKDYEEWEDER